MSIDVQKVTIFSEFQQGLAGNIKFPGEKTLACRSHAEYSIHM